MASRRKEALERGWLGSGGTETGSTEATDGAVRHGVVTPSSVGRRFFRQPALGNENPAVRLKGGLHLPQSYNVQVRKRVRFTPRVTSEQRNTPPRVAMNFRGGGSCDMG